MLQILTCRADIAARYGADAAIFLHNIVYWTLKNKAEKRHFHEGRYWTYASRKGLAKMYPLWSEDQIKRMIAKLRNSGALLVGEFNEDRRLRTSWYSPSDEILAVYGDADAAKSIGRNRPAHWTEPPGILGETAQCIYNETKKLQQEESPKAPQETKTARQTDAQTLFDHFWAAYPKRKGKEAARRAWRKLKPDMALYRVMAESLDRQKQSADWQRDAGQFIPYPATWLNGRRWEDEPDSLPELDDGGQDGI